MILLLEQLAKLSEAGKQLGNVSGFADLYDVVFDLIDDVFNSPNAALLLKSPRNGTLRVVASRGYNKDVVEHLRIAPGEGTTGQVLLSGQPLLVAETLNDAHYIQGVSNAVAEMAVPLRDGDNVIGVLDMESSEQRFTTEDLSLFATFGDQVATAVRNLRLKDQLEERARRLVAVAKSAQTFTQTTDLDTRLSRILDSASEALNLTQSAILLWDDTGDNLVIVAARGYDHDIIGMKVPKGSGVTGQVALKRQALVIDDVASRPDYIPGGDAPCCGSEMAVPLVFRDEVIGVLNSEHIEPNHFGDTDLLLATIFADLAASAIGNASSFSKMLQAIDLRNQRLKLIGKAAHALNTLHDIDDLIDEILKLACDALSLRSCALLLLERGAGELVMHSEVGYGSVDGLRIKLGHGITGTCALEGKPLLISDTGKDERYVSAKAGGLCEMAVPMVVLGEVIGVLDTEGPTVNYFDESDLDLFNVFASHAATAIHNAQLFRSLEDANEKLSDNVDEMARLNGELEKYAEDIVTANRDLEWQITQLAAIHETGKSISSSLDLDSILETILQMTGRIVGSTTAAIKLVDAETAELRVRAHSGRPSEITGTFSVFDFPLTVGDRQIGVFELVRKASSEIGDEERKMLETMASQAAVAIENARLFEDTQRVYYETLKSLAGALEARDQYTRGHSERVAAMSRDMAEFLGLDDRSISSIFNAALLHDIGKIGIRDEVLLAPRKLTADEMQIIYEHPQHGNTILLPLKFLGEIRDFVKSHHERWDGLGYPEKRQGDDIPLASRIIAVADAFDAMTSARPYRSALSRTQAISEIKNGAGTQFDPDVVHAFSQVILKNSHGSNND